MGKLSVLDFRDPWVFDIRGLKDLLSLNVLLQDASNFRMKGMQLSILLSRFRQPRMDK